MTKSKYKTVVLLKDTDTKLMLARCSLSSERVRLLSLRYSLQGKLVAFGGLLMARVLRRLVSRL